jgi:hypothetical protein
MATLTNATARLERNYDLWRSTIRTAVSCFNIEYNLAQNNLPLKECYKQRQHFLTLLLYFSSERIATIIFVEPFRYQQPPYPFQFVSSSNPRIAYPIHGFAFHEHRNWLGNRQNQPNHYRLLWRTHWFLLPQTLEYLWREREHWRGLGLCTAATNRRWINHLGEDCLHEDTQGCYTVCILI